MAAFENVEWVMKSIKNGYMLQFFCRLPRFNGVLMSTVREPNASFLREEIHNLLAKCAVETVPLTDRESGFYSRYFLVSNGAFPLHGTARYGSVRFTFGGFSTGYCTWYFFSTTSAGVPSDPYHYQNVTCKLC